MTEQDVERSSNLAVGILISAILLVVMLLAVVITIGALGISYSSYTGQQYQSYSTINETGAYINSSGYTLANVAVDNDAYTLTALFNYTDGTPFELGNASLSAGGVLTNATSTTYTNVSVSYTYRTDVTNDTTVATTYSGVQTNVVSMVSNFFALAPTIGTILAVVILIAIIVLLVMYVSRMRNTGAEQTYYSG